MLTTGEVSETVTVTSEGDAGARNRERQRLQSHHDDRHAQSCRRSGATRTSWRDSTPGVFGDGARTGSGDSVNPPEHDGAGRLELLDLSGRESSSDYRQRPTRLGQQFSDRRRERQQSRLGRRGGRHAESGIGERGAHLCRAPTRQKTGATPARKSKSSRRTGRTQFHGSAFFKYNDPALNAFNKYGGFNNAPPVRVQNRFRQFGGSIGGPIVRDSAFFFFSYEGFATTLPTRRTCSLKRRSIATSCGASDRTA